MKVQMRMVDILVRLKCPQCGGMREVHQLPHTISDMECRYCRDRDLEELYSPGEKPPEKNKPFQNCFEDCPLSKPRPDWNKIRLHAEVMIAHLDAIEREIEEAR